MAGVDRANSGSHLGHYDTIVLGSGIAGLAYASRLLQLQQPNNHGGGTNRRLQIIEARDRIGGRIASVHVDGWRLNPGANWIHGICNAKIEIESAHANSPAQAIQSTKGVCLVPCTRIE
jgi:monoamine oxidase